MGIFYDIGGGIVGGAKTLWDHPYLSAPVQLGKTGIEGSRALIGSFNAPDVPDARRPYQPSDPQEASLDIMLDIFRGVNRAEDIIRAQQRKDRPQPTLRDQPGFGKPSPQAQPKGPNYKSFLTQLLMEGPEGISDRRVNSKARSIVNPMYRPQIKAGKRDLRQIIAQGDQAVADTRGWYDQAQQGINKQARKAAGESRASIRAMGEAMGGAGGKIETGALKKLSKGGKEFFNQLAAATAAEGATAATGVRRQFAAEASDQRAAIRDLKSQRASQLAAVKQEVRDKIYNSQIERARALLELHPGAGGGDPQAKQETNAALTDTYVQMMAAQGPAANQRQAAQRRAAAANAAIAASGVSGAQAKRFRQYIAENAGKLSPYIQTLRSQAAAEGARDAMSNNLAAVDDFRALWNDLRDPLSGASQEEIEAVKQALMQFYSGTHGVNFAQK